MYCLASAVIWLLDKILHLVGMVRDGFQTLVNNIVGYLLHLLCCSAGFCPTSDASSWGYHGQFRSSEASRKSVLELKQKSIELDKRWAIVPIPSMYGIFTYIWLIFMVNVGMYPIHGWYGVCWLCRPTRSGNCLPTCFVDQVFLQSCHGHHVGCGRWVWRHLRSLGWLWGLAGRGVEFFPLWSRRSDCIKTAKIQKGERRLVGWFMDISWIFMHIQPPRVVLGFAYYYSLKEVMWWANQIGRYTIF